MQRTIRIQLHPSPTQAAALAETSRQFTAVFNAVCAFGWQHNQKNAIELHRALYYPLKAAYPALVSDLHIQARVKATEAIKSALALRRAVRKVSQPHSDACPPRYNLHTFRVDWQSRIVQMSLVGGRQAIHFHIPDYSTNTMVVRLQGHGCRVQVVSHIVRDVVAPTKKGPILCYSVAD